MAYDAQGRLTKKKEGASNLAEYAYGTATNRIDRIPGHLTKGRANTYVYDPDGNLVLDRSKKMTMDYDALGQVTAFRIYAGIPDETLTWEDVEDNGLQDRLWGHTIGNGGGGLRCFRSKGVETQQALLAGVGCCLCGRSGGADLTHRGRLLDLGWS